MAFVALDRLVNLHDGYVKGFTVGGQPLLLIQHQGQHHLVAGLCPHLDRSLLFGRICDGRIRCPAHNFEFSLTTGENVVFHGEQCEHLKVFEVAYDGGQIGVEV